MHTTKNIRIDGADLDLESMMRGLVPKPGTDYQKVLTVTVGPGESIDKHAHPEHTVLYYVNTRGVPIIIDGEPFYPADGQVIYLAPDVEHSVPTNHTDLDRVSIAMVVDL